MSELLYKDECYQLMGACFEVYQEKGSGFLEAVYQECLELELTSRGIAYQAQKLIDLDYKGQPLLQHYIADLICFDSILIELKAVGELADEHRSQVLNYLNATGLRLGLLINFGHHPKLEWQRIIL